MYLKCEDLARDSAFSIHSRPSSMRSLYVASSLGVRGLGGADAGAPAHKAGGLRLVRLVVCTSPGSQPVPRTAAPEAGFGVRCTRNLLRVRRVRATIRKPEGKRESEEKSSLSSADPGGTNRNKGGCTAARSNQRARAAEAKVAWLGTTDRRANTGLRYKLCPRTADSTTGSAPQTAHHEPQARQRPAQRERLATCAFFLP
jgi:hypothetical protein